MEKQKVEIAMDFAERHRFYAKVQKVRSVIRSCETDAQLDSAIRMGENLISQLPECDEKHIGNCEIQRETIRKIFKLMAKDEN